MYKDFKINPPFFEVGPKAFLYGEEMLKLAKVIDKVAMHLFYYRCCHCFGAGVQAVGGSFKLFVDWFF